MVVLLTCGDEVTYFLEDYFDHKAYISYMSKDINK